MGKRAVDYRKQFDLTAGVANGTAVKVQAMVLGNRGDRSAPGVAFTRNPATGENKLFGEYLVDAQGEVVVAGIRASKPIDRMAAEMPQMAEQLDVKGVGKLMGFAAKWGKVVRPDMHVGICGEHGGHPASIAFWHMAGLDYVTCSASRVPVARLAAAHSALLADH